MKIQQRLWTKTDGWQTYLGPDLNEKARLVLVFGETDQLKKETYFQEIKNYYPQAQIISATTAGEILDTKVLDNTIVATAIEFEKTTIETASTEIASMEDSLAAGEKLATSLPKPNLVHVLVFSEGINVNGSKLVQGLSSGLPENVAVTGGLAGDQDKFQKTLVGLNTPAKPNMITVVGLYGTHIKIGYGSFGGWDSFGPERLVTKSRNNILYELDGKSALSLYKKYLGDKASELPASGLLFPLMLRKQSQAKESSLVRTILAVNEADQSMTFAGDIPENTYVRLMKANFQRIIEGAGGAADATHNGFGASNPEFALLISCVGRKLVLKQRTEEEVERVREVLGNNPVMSGFYSYGEVCPTAPTKSQCELHNQTMTITTLKEV